MRPDEHKKKESRRYQARKKNQGDATAAEVAERRRQAAIKARDTGTSVAAIRRRNGELPSIQQVRESAEATVRIKSSKFSRRKIDSNRDRYTEISDQDAMLQDAELGIDRETTNLVAMLEQQDETEPGSTYFKFKDETVDTGLLEQQDQSLFHVNFDVYESILGQVDCRQVLGLSEEDSALVDAAFGEQPLTPIKPIVPAFTKTAQGLVLFNQKPKAEATTEPSDGIYIRNERRMPQQQRNNTTTPASSSSVTITNTDDHDDEDLDELLAMGPSKKVQASPNDASPKIAAAPSIPKPRIAAASLPRPSAAMKKQEPRAVTKKKDDDEAWLDDILG